ncbi:Pollen-specific leucine-rich repeat extensin-like protein, partial [Musa troglodytarum]
QSPPLLHLCCINLNSADIIEYLPTKLGFLTDATLLHINSKRFYNIIPQNISYLKLLHELNANNNRFIDLFSDIALHLILLKYLDLQLNDLEGVLPPVLFDKEFNIIFLNNNSFNS